MPSLSLFTILEKKNINPQTHKLKIKRIEKPQILK